MIIRNYKISFPPLIIITFFCLIIHCAYSQNTSEQHALLFKDIATKDAASTKKRIPKLAPKKNISINYTNEELLDVINNIAAQKEANIIIPVKTDQLIKGKITTHLEEKVSIDQAWNFLITLLDFAGYSLIPIGDTYEIVKNNKDINREPLPLFIGVDPDILPNTEMRIRYIYYLSNLKIDSNANKDQQNELNAILTRLLPQIKDAQNFYLDPVTNSIIFSEKSNEIKSVANIIKYLDKIEIQEKMEFIKLRYLDAQFVADLFNKEIIPPNTPPGYLTTVPSDSGYFSHKLKIMPDIKNNSLIILGKKQAIERVKEFVFKYLDTPLESGNSMLHVYQLQYLDAGQFAPILQKIVKSEQTTKGTGQSTTANTEGPERFFGEVIIRSDAPENKSPEENKYWGGNKLIIAASGEDWKRIRKLIEELDVPQPQVIIEVLIAQLTAAQIKTLGTMLRNPSCFPLPKNVNAQSAQLAGVITNGTQAGVIPVVAPTTLQADLLGQVVNPSPGSIGKPATNIASLATPGTTMISFSDQNGSAWNVLEVYDVVSWNNVITNPHVIATNNVETKIKISVDRFLNDRATNTAGSGATEILNKWINAPVIVKVKPCISSGTIVNLTLDISIDVFDSAATGQTQSEQTRNTRKIYTNANVASGDILALGGLTRLDDINTVTRTPILGQIPIIGYLFKNRTRNDTATNLTAFICPTVIQPRLRSGISNYTTDYVNITKAYSKEGGLFESLQCPITRWFFTSDCYNPEEDLKDFVGLDELTRKKEKFIPSLTKEEKYDEEYRIIDADKTIIATNTQEPLPTILDKTDTNKIINDVNTPVIAQLIHTPQKNSTTLFSKNNENKEVAPDEKNIRLKELYKNIKNPLLSS